MSVSTPEYKKVTVELTDGTRVFADLTPLQGVYCFPKDKYEWDQTAPDSFGSALVWASRFEAHIDQIIGLAYKTEPPTKSA
ncbi:MAG: hypothetical protein C5B49_12785 [Bdellovibrio sp.]|nr:MAG: hypothetical protein C5B49_12785 [Bdellovibrio sp.]